MSAAPVGFTGNGGDYFIPLTCRQGNGFIHYAKRLDTVEINASFYSWPTVANVKAWRRQPIKRTFIYTVKVCELITHIKRFKGTKTLIMDFGMSPIMKRTRPGTR